MIANSFRADSKMYDTNATLDNPFAEIKCNKIFTLSLTNYVYSNGFFRIGYRRIGYNLNVMRQSRCLVFNPIMVDCYADRSKAILLWWLFRFMFWCLKFFVLLAPYVCFHIFS